MSPMAGARTRVTVGLGTPPAAIPAWMPAATLARVWSEPSRLERSAMVLSPNAPRSPV